MAYSHASCLPQRIRHNLACIKAGLVLASCCHTGCIQGDDIPLNWGFNEACMHPDAVLLAELNPDFLSTVQAAASKGEQGELDMHTTW